MDRVDGTPAATQLDDHFARYRPALLAGWPIDLMFVDDATFTKLLEQSQEGPARARVASARHLVALKLEHRFAKDWADIVGLLRTGRTGLSVEDLRTLCERYASPDLFVRLKDEVRRP